MTHTCCSAILVGRVSSRPTVDFDENNQFNEIWNDFLK